jgi:hypothetical protein
MARPLTFRSHASLNRSEDGDAALTLDVAGSAPIGKDQGKVTSAHLGVRVGF